MKYVVICPNGCKHQKTTAPYRMRYDKAAKRMVPEFITTAPKCPECGELMVFAEEPSVIPDFSVGTFKGLPDEQKKEVIKKRYQKGMTKGGNDEVEIRKRSAIKKMIGYDN